MTLELLLIIIHCSSKSRHFHVWRLLCVAGGSAERADVTAVSCGYYAQPRIVHVDRQPGHARSLVGHAVLGRAGRQVRAEGDRIPDHGAVPGQLGHPAGGEDGTGSDDSQVLGRRGRQRGGRQLSHVRERAE